MKRNSIHPRIHPRIPVIVCATLCIVLAVGSILRAQGPSPGQGFHEDCNGTCTTTGASPNAECWNTYVHQNHGDSDPAENSTGNCGTLPSGQIICGDGSGQASWAWAGSRRSDARFSCTGTTCVMSGTMDCNGSRNSWVGGCGVNSGRPVLTIFRDAASCNGSPGNSMVCQCSGSTTVCASF